MKLCFIILFIISCIGGSLCEVPLDGHNENSNLDCADICRQWRDATSSKQKIASCKCRVERCCDEKNTTSSLTRSKRETPTTNKDSVVGQSNPSSHNRLIHQRNRHRIHQQRAHHISPQTHQRRLHHGHARHRITPHHQPHLVGSVRERFGGGEKEGGSALKRLRERQKQKGDAKQQEQEGGTVRQAENKGQEKQQSGNFQIITQPPNLVDEK